MMIQDPSNPTWPMWRGGASFRTRRAGGLPDLPPCSFHCKPASGTLRNLSTIEGLFPSHRRLTVFRWRLAGCMLALHGNGNGNGNGVWDWDMDERTFFPFQENNFLHSWHSIGIGYRFFASFNLKCDRLGFIIL
jgi:hypothetical protein